MEIKAQAKFLRISPRKLRLITGLIQSMAVAAAADQLKHLDKKGSTPVLKLLNSAIANASHNNKLKVEGLFIKSAFVDQGPTIKRWRPRAFGRAGQIRKRTSHLTIILAEKKAKPEIKFNLKIPSAKSQIPNNVQIPMAKTIKRRV